MADLKPPAPKGKPPLGPPKSSAPGQGDVFTELLTLFFIVYLIGALITGVTNFLQGNGLLSHGWSGLSYKNLILGNTRSLASVLNPINARVEVSADATDVYDEAGGQKIGTHQLGDYGRVLRGPVTVNGEKYYYVDFETGVDGWVKEGDLNYVDPRTRPLSKTDPLGSDVVSSVDGTSVLSDPGGTVLGTQPAGAHGMITRGPIEKDGKQYFYVDFDTGPDGWVSADQLSLYDNGTRHLSSADGVGTQVISASDTDVRDENGTIIGTQKNGAHGTITKGPITINGVKYWYVDYQDGTDGWVAEDQLLIQTPREKTAGEKIAYWLVFFGNLFKYGLLLLAIGMIVALIIIVRRLTKIRVNTREKLFPTLAVTEPKVSRNPKWERVMTYVESPNQNDWRLAIIEADIMLSELLDTMHLMGDSIGEKLKGVEKSDFTTLDMAWEAHKVRNEIAHAGGDFQISQREALRVIELYSKVFKEFQMI